MSKRFLLCLCCAVVFLFSGGVFTDGLQDGPYRTRAAVRAHLQSGAVVSLPDGFRLEIEAGKAYLIGEGIRSTAVAIPGATLQRIPLDHLQALEHYEPEQATSPVSPVPDVLLAGTPYSSPMVYAGNTAQPDLLAEGFSGSMVRPLEATDVDQLPIRCPVDQPVALELVNQALETQYLNAVELLTVTHPIGYKVLPSVKGSLVALGRHVPFRATNRAGEPVTHLLEHRDDRAYRSDSVAVAALTHHITMDWVDVTVMVPPGATEMVIALGVRNTAFNTILLENTILATRGFEALDFMDRTWAHPLKVWRLHRWSQQYMGFRVARMEGTREVSLERIGGTGPQAWRAVAIPVGVSDTQDTRIRLSFLPDTWAIDWVAVSFDSRVALETTARRPEQRYDADQTALSVAPLQAADDAYAILRPGMHHSLIFAPSAVPSSGAHTCLIRLQGYYTKWIRRDWLQVPDRARKTFRPGEETIQDAARYWLPVRRVMP